MRACSATRTSSSPAPSGELGRCQRPDDLDLVAVDGDRRAARRTRCRAPARRTRLRSAAPAPVPTVVGWPNAASPAGRPFLCPACLESYYEITRLTTRTQRAGAHAKTRSLEQQLEPDVGGHEPEPLVETVGVRAGGVRGQLHPVATQVAGPLDGSTEQGARPCRLPGGPGARAPTRSRRTDRPAPAGAGRRSAGRLPTTSPSSSATRTAPSPRAISCSAAR